MIGRKPSASQRNRRLIALETICSGFRLERFHCQFQKISKEIDNKKGPPSGPFFIRLIHYAITEPSSKTIQAQNREGRLALLQEFNPVAVGIFHHTDPHSWPDLTTTDHDVAACHFTSSFSLIKIGHRNRQI